MDSVECIVIGAGVVGLAVARALALTGREVLVLEAGTLIGSETSSRNSEVIHAGIYYPSGSLKARLCVQGKKMLYDYCQERNIHHERLGKLIVATGTQQLPGLKTLSDQANRNGAGLLQPLSAADVRAMEPSVHAVAGLYSSSTGIIDSHGLMLSLQGDLEQVGGMVAFGSAVTGMDAITESGTERIKITCNDYSLGASWVINSAGLDAVRVGRMLTETVPSAYFARGRYYQLSGISPFNHLVYPMPEPGGLGVHVTLDLAHQARFGPDVQWISQPDYAFLDDQRKAFASAITAYYPELDLSRLQPAYTGVRPKISGPTEPAGDFRVDGPTVHGISGLVNLLGIESPGLTASLALAEHVKEVVDAS